jgi:hypothetical protein
MQSVLQLVLTNNTNNNMMTIAFFALRKEFVNNKSLKH